MFDWTLVSVAGTLVFTILTAVWSLAWWLARQFAAVKDAILEKLEYHERHDDIRFDALTKDLWEIRVRNASVDNANRGRVNAD